MFKPYCIYPECRNVLEALEGRLLLDGDVSIFFSGNTLRIVGDTFDNAIAVTQPGGANTLVITGLNDTTINGSSDPLTVEDLIGNVRVNFGQGNNTITVDDTALPRHLVIVDGTGQNTVDIEGLSLPGSLAIRNGNGDDLVSIIDSDVGLNTTIRNAGGDNEVTLGGTFGNVSISNSSGFDTLNFTNATILGNVKVRNGVGGSNFAFADSIVRRRFSLASGTGDDVLAFTNTTIDGASTINTGRGDVTTTILNSNLGMGNGVTSSTTRNIRFVNTAGLANMTVEETAFGRNFTTSFGTGSSTLLFMNGMAVDGNLLVRGGRGVNDVTFDGATVNGTVQLTTGPANDTIAVNSSELNGRVALTTGSGTDTISLGGASQTLPSSLSVFGPTTLRSGAGDDLLLVGMATTPTSAQFLSTSRFNGGTGFNTMEEGADVQFATTPTVFNFDPVIV